MKYGYRELKGKCKTCYFKCVRVEDINFNGVERCDYATSEQISIEQTEKECKDDI